MVKFTHFRIEEVFLSPVPEGVGGGVMCKKMLLCKIVLNAKAMVSYILLRIKEALVNLVMHVITEGFQGLIKDVRLVMVMVKHILLRIKEELGKLVKIVLEKDFLKEI